MYRIKREDCRLKNEFCKDVVRKSAFTLAETLITLGIIGVVAAVTLPTLVRNYQEKSRVTALTKFYAMLSSAYEHAKFEQGDVTQWEGLKRWTSTGYYGPSSICFDKLIRPYFKIMKECDRYEDGCFASKVPQWNNSTTFSNLGGGLRKFAVLENGMSVGILASEADYCIVYVDVNGLRKPNTVGLDAFQLHLEKNKVETYQNEGTPMNCYSNPWTCSGWVLTYKNMDYLHCEDLQFGVKTTCK